LNDKIYIKLLRERLLRIREKQNKLKSKRFLSYPVGSVILVRDNRPKVNKKLKPIFYKLPQKIINEYRCTVFAIDFLGKVRKHSKNNIRFATERTIELYGKLPMDIKLILGEEFSAQKWDEIKNVGVVPAYLADIELGEISQMKTRGSDLQKDSHLIETDAPAATAENVAEPFIDDDEGEGGVIDDLLGDENLRILGELHDRGVLINPDLTLQDLPKLHADTIDNPVIGDTDLQLEVENNLEFLDSNVDNPEQT
jgi:hypothetical protein